MEIPEELKPVEYASVYANIQNSVPENQACRDLLRQALKCLETAGFFMHGDRRGGAKIYIDRNFADVNITTTVIRGFIEPLGIDRSVFEAYISANDERFISFTVSYYNRDGLGYDPNTAFELCRNSRIDLFNRIQAKLLGLKYEEYLTQTNQHLPEF